MGSDEVRKLLRPGILAILTWDEARVEQVLEAAESSKLYEAVYHVDGDRGRVYRRIGGASVPLTAEVEIEGQRKSVPLTIDSFFRKVLPSSPRALVAVSLFSYSRAPLRATPMAAGRHTIIFVTGDSELLPGPIQSRIEEYADLYFATEQELLEIAGSISPSSPGPIAAMMAGLTLGEAREIAVEVSGGAMPPQKLSERIARVKTARMRSLGIDQDKSLGGIEDAPFDAPYKRVLRHYVVHGSVCFLGPPGSGKTYMAKRLIGTEYGDPFTLDAGRILQEKDSERTFLQALTYLRNMRRVGLLINEYDHLIADRRFYARMLRFLEEKKDMLFACTIVNHKMILRDDGGVSEAMRPGRIDEIIPVLPPMEPKTRIATVAEMASKLAEEGKAKPLGPGDLRRIAFAAPLLYPADYMSLIIKYSQSPENLKAFVRDYDEDSRRRQIEGLLDACRRAGNTSSTLLDELERMLDAASM